MRNEERIAKIKLRLEAINQRISETEKATRHSKCRYRYPVALERLYKSYVLWEERLTLAELGTPKVYSRTATKGASHASHE